MKKRKTGSSESGPKTIGPKMDYHHLLFQKRHWGQGYAKALREHPYMGKQIPRDTLHRGLHSKLHDIPVPNGRECRMAYEALIQAETDGSINVVTDTCEQRLDFLINLWRDICPATVAMLEWEKQIISKFYTSSTH